MKLASLPMLIWLAEPMSFSQGMVLIGAILVGTLILVTIGAYVAVRLIAYVFNTRRDAWESAAGRLGLTIDRSAKTLQKPLVGTRNGYAVRVEYYSVPKSRNSFTNCASAEVAFDKPMDFSLQMSKDSWLHQMTAGLAGSNIETGHELLDKAFRITCSDTPGLMKLLDLEMMDGKNTTLLNDLLITAKRYQRVDITDRSVTVGVPVEPGDAEAIDAVIDHAIYIAGRFKAAQLRLMGN